MSEEVDARKLLVVDDEPEVEPMFRQRMRREVRAGVYEFLFARSGRHALQVLEENPDVRLVITDLSMPEMNGWQLLEALGEQWPGLPSMVVSAYGDRENVRLAEEKGARGFVVKPVDFTELRSKVVASLEGAKPSNCSRLRERRWFAVDILYWTGCWERAEWAGDPRKSEQLLNQSQGETRIGGR